MRPNHVSDAPFRRLATLLASIVLAFVLAAVLPRPAESAPATAFGAGSSRLSIVAGSGTAFNETYTIIGAGVGYYIIDNLELGVEYESWSGGRRHIDRTTPSLTYVVPAAGTVRPYVGAFYRWTSIEQHANTNDAGGRAGALFLSGRNMYLGVGAVYEKHLACDRTVYDACSVVYPEVLLAFLF